MKQFSEFYTHAFSEYYNEAFKLKGNPKSQSGQVKTTLSLKDEEGLEIEFTYHERSGAAQVGFHQPGARSNAFLSLDKRVITKLSKLMADFAKEAYAKYESSGAHKTFPVDQINFLLSNKMMKHQLDTAKKALGSSAKGIGGMTKVGSDSYPAYDIVVVK